MTDSQIVTRCTNSNANDGQPACLFVDWKCTLFAWVHLIAVVRIFIVLSLEMLDCTDCTRAA